MKQRKYHRVERAKKVDNKIKRYEILVRPDKTYNAIQKKPRKNWKKNRKKNWIKQKKKINWRDRWKKSHFLYCQQMSFIAFGTVNSIHYYRSSLHSRRYSVFCSSILCVYVVCSLELQWTCKEYLKQMGTLKTGQPVHIKHFAGV